MNTKTHGSSGTEPSVAPLQESVYVSWGRPGRSKLGSRCVHPRQESILRGAERKDRTLLPRTAKFHRRKRRSYPDSARSPRQCVVAGTPGALDAHQPTLTDIVPRLGAQAAEAASGTRRRAASRRGRYARTTGDRGRFTAPRKRSAGNGCKGASIRTTLESPTHASVSVGLTSANLAAALEFFLPRLGMAKQERASAHGGHVARAVSWAGERMRLFVPMIDSNTVFGRTPTQSGVSRRTIRRQLYRATDLPVARVLHCPLGCAEPRFLLSLRLAASIERSREWLSEPPRQRFSQWALVLQPRRRRVQQRLPTAAAVRHPVPTPAQPAVRAAER
jgi:hypothetical protein